MWAVWNACRRPGIGVWCLAAGALLAMGLANFYLGWYGIVLLPVVALAAPQARQQRVRTAGVLAACAVVLGLLALTPAWAGLLFQHFGVASPFWVAAGLVVLVGLLALRLDPGERATTAPLPEAAAAEAGEPS